MEKIDFFCFLPTNLSFYQSKNTFLGRLTINNMIIWQENLMETKNLAIWQNFIPLQKL